jgi:hypothetical protein
LAGKSVNQFRLVAAGDGEARLAEERLADGDLALVALAVDDPNAVGSDGDVVDVGSRLRDATVVKDEHSWGRAQAHEPVSYSFLPICPTGPDALMRRLLAESEHQAADVRVSLPSQAFALSQPAVMHPARTRSRSPEVKFVICRGHQPTLGDARLVSLGPHGHLYRRWSLFAPTTCALGCPQTASSGSPTL